VRVLVTSTPGVGHVLPLVALATALRSAGHHVVWATGPDAQDLVRGAGFESVTAGTDQASRAQRFRDGWPDVGRLAPRQRRAVAFPALFATLSAELMYDDLSTVLEDRPVDLIVHEPCELAAAPIAARLGIAQATVGFGRFVPDHLLDGAADDVAGLWEMAGRAVPADLGLYSGAYFHPLPSSLEPVRADRPIHLLRPIGDDTAPRAEADRRGRRPSLYVTFGTEFGPAAPWRSVIDAIGQLDLDALVTVGKLVDPDSFGSLPDGVRVERWVPQRDALAASDLVVSHGGSGAMIGALAAGLAHLAIPLGADHFENADLIVEHGIGTIVETPDPSPTEIAERVVALLADDDTMARSRQAAAELVAMPSPTSAVALLEHLVDSN